MILTQASFQHTSLAKLLLHFDNRFRPGKNGAVSGVTKTSYFSTLWVFLDFTLDCCVLRSHLLPNTCALTYAHFTAHFPRWTKKLLIGHAPHHRTGRSKRIRTSSRKKNPKRNSKRNPAPSPLLPLLPPTTLQLQPRRFPSAHRHPSNLYTHIVALLTKRNSPHLCFRR